MTHADGQRAAGAFSLAAMRLCFLEGADLGEREAVLEAARRVRARCPRSWTGRSDSEQVKQRAAGGHRRGAGAGRLRRAHRRRRRELFWGDDEARAGRGRPSRARPALSARAGRRTAPGPGSEASPRRAEVDLQLARRGPQWLGGLARAPALGPVADHLAAAAAVVVDTPVGRLQRQAARVRFPVTTAWKRRPLWSTSTMSPVWIPSSRIDPNSSRIRPPTRRRPRRDPSASESGGRRRVRL